MAISSPHAGQSRRKQARVVSVYDLNMDLRFGTATWNVDLVLGTPATQVDTAGAPIVRATPSTVRIAIETKGATTEHRKAVRIGREISRRTTSTHQLQSPSNAAGVGREPRTDVRFSAAPRATVHGDPQKVARLVEHCMTEMRNVTESGGGSAYGIDAKCALVVDFDNIQPNAGRYVSARPRHNLVIPAPTTASSRSSARSTARDSAIDGVYAIPPRSGASQLPEQSATPKNAKNNRSIKPPRSLRSHTTTIGGDTDAKTADGRARARLYDLPAGAAGDDGDGGHGRRRHQGGAARVRRPRTRAADARRTSAERVSPGTQPRQAQPHRPPEDRRRARDRAPVAAIDGRDGAQLPSGRDGEAGLRLRRGARAGTPASSTRTRGLGRAGAEDDAPGVRHRGAGAVGADVDDGRGRRRAAAGGRGDRGLRRRDEPGDGGDRGAVRSRCATGGIHRFHRLHRLHRWGMDGFTAKAP